MTRHNHRRRRDVRQYMTDHGVTYTEALRAIDAADDRKSTATANPFRPRPVDQGGPEMPAVVTLDNDVNPICGHYLGNLCTGCGVCTTCDGCYCAELRQEAELDAYFREVEREHAEHWQEPGEDCPTCESDRKRSKDFTECPKCGKALQGFWHFREHCPPYCRKDKPHAPGLDWSHLIGKRITIDTHWLYEGDMSQYAASWTGTVTGPWTNPGTGTETGMYELELDPTVPQPRDDITTTPFNPREFTITEH
ncbi:Hypothetical protein AJAP_42615 (plasmid) [Amycolatopsis japonica]|uniref:Uncharacterized protein n=1 Tax=Amycolatopsis japonica TaxID=208439 RepID=A0A075VEE4_9PSEU|nr:hypothetical protein [Amycolatopsis japonica]AIG81290.1 Hypothetical protein AJAP_42615 [Amycolatopsis japonica]